MSFSRIIIWGALVDGLVIGAVLVILLWEPANWLTAYLVRRSKDQGII